MEEYFSCSCSSDEHTLRFIIDEDPMFPELYTSVYLHQYRSWYKRLWIAIKYVFGYPCKYGHWDCFTLDSKDLPRMKALLSRYEELHCGCKNGG